MLILITSTVAALAMNNNAKNQDEKIARIYQDKKLIYTIDLNSVKETYRLTIDGKDKSENIVEVRNGSIGIINASCPDHICIDTGFIDNSSVPVVCLPNKIIIEISDNTDNSIDAVAN
ncbi:MAG: NusG domain II-containing protein [Candidatus Pseudoruminococcus sp.]|uniref:NusG domain II-containing protein n=1 Tax=Candidatus Pseudoruminococcus sp. TaxID=3101048 RepID=UPI002A76BCC5|nr:NusG domain II-containing protein [Ruminococcus sp.]MDY2783840.1 NusG domain II-containing protein [Candidatus Pseudoruminococcus sp.]